MAMENPPFEDLFPIEITSFFRGIVKPPSSTCARISLLGAEGIQPLKEYLFEEDADAGREQEVTRCLAVTRFLGGKAVGNWSRGGCGMNSENHQIFNVGMDWAEG